MKTYQVCRSRYPSPFHTCKFCSVGYKRIGKYYRQNPGCPEYLGLRVDPSGWLKEEKCQLLLKYLEYMPSLSKALQARNDNVLQYGLGYIKARETLMQNSCQVNDGYREIQQRLCEDDAGLCGSWEDHIERLEFYRSRKSADEHATEIYELCS